MKQKAALGRLFCCLEFGAAVSLIEDGTCQASIVWGIVTSGDLNPIAIHAPSSLA